MASFQEPEVQFAQRLASNEKPVRTKAIKKLRKYINVRSQKATGGFTGDELLKLWKGLFYCLWMQDKPLLQEELSNQISSLIHSFHDVDAQFLYLESFLQTFKREWTGIDRLRMDKFFQVVRFMFRQTFELLKRKDWESSLVSRFLELLTTQLLHSSCDAPSGLQLHVLDLYMTELAAVGSAELSADQNLTFIEPFCKTATKTKDRTLLGAICSSIFSTIIDQAPFAIEDLMKEVKAAEDSDSGQASEEDDEDERQEGKTLRKPVSQKRTGRQINGKKSSKEDEDEDEEDDEEDDDDEELLHLEDSDTEAPCDEDVGPVLQFDFAALADKLFELASRSSTPSQNRQRLYKIIKVLRDLSEGIFPQDEYPEEVSTDEDDDMFGSRKRMKRGRGRMEEDDEGAPATKKSKASGKKKEASAPSQQSEDAAEDDREPADLTSSNENKKKKKRRKKKKKAGQGGGDGEHTAAQSTTAETEAQKPNSASSVSVTEAASPHGQSEPLLLSEGHKQPSVTVTEETSQPAEPEVSSTSADATADAAATDSGKKKKKKKRKKSLKDESQIGAEAASSPSANEESTPETETKEEQAESKVNGLSTEEDGASTGPESQTDSPTPAKKKKKKKKKKNLKADEATETETDAQVEGKHTDAEITSAGEETSSNASITPSKKKVKKKSSQEETTASAAADENSTTPLKTRRRKSNQKESKAADTQEGDSRQKEDAEKLSMTTPTKKKKKRLAAARVDESKEETQEVGSEDAAIPQEQTEVLSSAKAQAKKKKKRKIPVVFEFEADELEAAASINGLAEGETTAKKVKLLAGAGEPSTPLSTNKPQKKKKTSAASTPDFITFQSNAAIPTPLFCKTKTGRGTPLSSKKKSQTPKSESKKVTFGLKNNKTAEFRKTDRSLLVSPDGSSRVPFDPQQKPKCGVLKSPATPLSSRFKKTLTGTKKTSCSTPTGAAVKRRPSAADFF